LDAVIRRVWVAAANFEMREQERDQALLDLNRAMKDAFDAGADFETVRVAAGLKEVEPDDSAA
jgi:hypothetical protein